MWPQNYFEIPKHTMTKSPSLHESVFIAKGAAVVGDVRMGRDSSVWFNAVLRGDINYIEIGERSNIQDGSVVHVENARACIVGNDVVVGHHVNLHACQIGDGALIGIGAIVLSGAKIGKGAIIGAGTLVLEGQEIPPYAMAVGSPAKVIRTITEEDAANHLRLAAKYVMSARLFKAKGFHCPSLI
jgi:carbonic anhydrase/acetyltransferase-like protein (isoleucine patch superfamily)